MWQKILLNCGEFNTEWWSAVHPAVLGLLLYASSASWVSGRGRERSMVDSSEEKVIADELAMNRKICT